MRKIIAPALLFTLGLLSLPLSIVSSLYLGDSADVGAKGAATGQFVIPVSGLIPTSIAVTIVGALWLGYAVPKYVKVDSTAPVDAVDDDSVLARAAAVQTMAIEVVPGSADDVISRGNDVRMPRRS